MKLAKLIAAGTVTLALMTGTAFAGDTKNKADDAWITTKVKADLAKDTATKAHDINVDTKSGVVVLTGTVTSAAEKEKAEANAKAVKGVVDVENQLKVAAAD